MKPSPKLASLIAATALLSACQQDLVRSDFIDDSAGDALATNSINQTVDPWNRHVYNTDIETSSSRQAEAQDRYHGNNGTAPSRDLASAPSTR